MPEVPPLLTTHQQQTPARYHKTRAAGGRIEVILQWLGRDSHGTTAMPQGAARWRSGNMGSVSVYGYP